LSVGLIALLDDIAGLARVAAASLDDIAAHTAKAGAKAAGVVIDDAAVTPRYVVGFDPARELPIVWKIAKGSLRNKLLILLPAALLLSVFAPSAITPLLMLGGAYLCYEGAEKVYEAIVPHHSAAQEAQVGAVAADPHTLENVRVAGAIKTDFILSAEIMAITLASVPDGSFVTEAAVLAIVGIGITVIVYGGVALIVKADDVGLTLAQTPGESVFGAARRATGRALVLGMPWFLSGLAVVGTAAMIWVGGGILVHGLEEYGLPQVSHAIAAVAEAAGRAVPAIAGAIAWIVTAAASGVVGLIVGALLIPVAEHVIAPMWKRLRPLTPGLPSRSGSA
jgi:predicted DNA repair protein MutK